MVDVMPAGKITLSDSNTKTRPGFNAYLMTDANVKGDSVTQSEQQRLARQMKFPSLIGRQCPDSLKDPQNLSNTAFKRWNDEGDHRALAPFRSCDNSVDPVSGFVSVSGDIDRKTGRTHIAPLVQLNTTPQSYNPRQYHSIRADCPTAPPETVRVTENDPGTPYAWNGRKILDSSLRASLGGWTSDQDPRKPDKIRFRGDEAPKQGDKSQEIRDQLSKRYMYTSSTQRSYEEIPWDSHLSPRRWASTTTLEEKPDMISQRFTKKRYEPAAEEWQAVGRSWDWFQTRKNYYKTGIPIPGIVFCSPCPRAQQIPGYSGCIGGDNIHEIENVNESFQPYTVKRVNLPRSSETSHRPNIPGYSGCTLYKSTSTPAHTSSTPPEPQTTALVHRKMPSTPNLSEFKRNSQMSKMVTTVPPYNPFNKREWQPVEEKN
ncbi:hypothetical protein CAPTEDRAFT_229181 [Capitella teleta]|uniref:Spermatogenesis-associated protein 48 n=1 Tax=Capitella teleta TaxID=283909 RepID=R7TMX8_CAPTE|nr:hypothetical protein CAPTEDRAFT_229181 [Capitella teleta]|eukprot:ELT92906.1 hypothetical protein CAPTEDRAFT_229181 [Capitella teleta]